MSHGVCPSRITLRHFAVRLKTNQTASSQGWPEVTSAAGLPASRRPKHRVE